MIFLHGSEIQNTDFPVCTDFPIFYSVSQEILMDSGLSTHDFQGLHSLSLTVKLLYSKKAKQNKKPLH